METKCFAVIFLTVSVIYGVKSAAIKSAEHDAMHPQSFLFNSPNENSAGRQRRAVMPPITFTAPMLEKDGDYWNNLGQDILKVQLQKNVLNKNVAKNIIMFLGDGMSIPTLAATRIYMGGEEKVLSFEKFPYNGLSKTYCASTQVADSACSATAYLGGIKANYATIGLTAAVALGDCRGENNTAHHVHSIAKWAQDYGMSTGLVTTTQVTHASPAGVYAHTANRNWESNQILLDDGGDPEVCTDIAKQLVNGQVGKKLKVVMGGGRQEFLPTYEQDCEGRSGKRTDGIDLIKRWKHKHQKHNAAYVQTKDELLNISQDTDYVLGLFDSSHMPYNIDSDHAVKPTLAEMVGKALDVLEKDQKGYFLFVEGGKIDHAHHSALAQRAFDETVEFAKAVELARQRTSEENTLIVVTSDHSHTMSIAGYSSRGNDILGIGNGLKADDNLPYATISYANGPGHSLNVNQQGRTDLLKTNMRDGKYTFPATVPLKEATHGGDDVAVFASGPWAHIFTGTYEQNYIPHAMAYAACIGKGLTACHPS
ncbi:alkaline phosphatase [Bradysia coprophila]|uniref:alkaline phosphatase n=1 Tax=Bradysia coprophila TaxID=38358 RepID=UPI00187D87DD|nr:alkaline phosphatase [Bradysia coprophila]